MYELSWALRTKPDWQRKAKDPEIQRKWRAEAMDEDIDAYKHEKLSKKMVSSGRGRKVESNFIRLRLITPWTNLTGTLKLQTTREELRLGS
jgi:CHASE3 domain sensor protein